MKYFKIEENKVYFLKDSKTWTAIDQIDKADLLNLLDCALEDGFEMDEFEKEKIANPAHQIIYKNIFERFAEIVKNRSRFKDESQSLYRDAIEKYSR